MRPAPRARHLRRTWSSTGGVLEERGQILLKLLPGRRVHVQLMSPIVILEGNAVPEVVLGTYTIKCVFCGKVRGDEIIVTACHKNPQESVLA